MLTQNFIISGVRFNQRVFRRYGWNMSETNIEAREGFMLKLLAVDPFEIKVFIIKAMNW